MQFDRYFTRHHDFATEPLRKVSRLVTDARAATTGLGRPPRRRAASGEGDMAYQCTRTHRIRMKTQCCNFFLAGDMDDSPSDQTVPGS
jgi:hypothetical protein